MSPDQAVKVLEVVSCDVIRLRQLLSDHNARLGKASKALRELELRATRYWSKLNHWSKLNPDWLMDNPVEFKLGQLEVSMRKASKALLELELGALGLQIAVGVDAVKENMELGGRHLAEGELD